MDTRPTNFSVVSKGYCFLCLNKIPLQVDIPPSSANSFQDISRYLKLDMRKVFIQGEPVPPHLLAQVEKSNLKVELCEQCTFTTQKISKLCRQLEKLKMEIESGLKTIHGKISEANETGRTEQFRGLAAFKKDSGMGGWMEILEVLRKETKQKCSSMVKEASPRLQIRRLTSGEIQQKTFRVPKKEVETIPDQMLPSELQQQNDIKLANPDSVNWTLEDEDGIQSEAPFVDNSDSEDGLDDSISQSAVGYVGGENRLGNATSGKLTGTIDTTTVNNLTRKCTINPETGKYKCQSCTLEYGSKMGVHHHYNKVHCKIRIKCKICGKEFTQHGTYKRHHEGVHLGVRFQCKLCKRSFSQKGNLMIHQRKAGCGITVKTKSKESL